MVRLIKMISIDENLYKKAKEYDKIFSRAVHDGLNYFLTAKLQEAEKKMEIARLEEQIQSLKTAAALEVGKNELNAWIGAQKEPEALRGKIYELAEKEKRNWEEIAREFKAGTRTVY